MNSFQILLGSANQNKIRLLAEIDEEKNLEIINSIFSDERRIQQILLNILSNALKFTNKDGQIKILVKILSKQSENNKQAIDQLEKEVKMHIQRKKSV